MIKLELTGVHTQVSDDLKKYINKKIGKLDRFLPKHARESAHGEVFIKESKNKGKPQHTAEVVLKLKQETLTAKETTVNPFAAVDIVEAKLKNQMRKYKDKHTHKKFHHKVLARMKRNNRSSV
ncbi:MAG: ribosome-associated translation inhibitor RaiA [Candidatus Saccharibacteria bacterium]|nr:ribosome-associated translation inhibitor RaiA [Candidatus Saccharibacteria bacterium]